MEDAPLRPALVRPGDYLPPVETPNAGFIVQLFIVPAVIVVVIAVVVGLINWLAQMGNDPAAYVAALERDNDARWQVAVSLAEALRNPVHADFRQDPVPARRLAALLEREIAEGSLAEKEVQLRVYLCHALGQFQSAEVIPALITAAQTQRSSEELEVRVSGLRDLAVHAQLTPSFDPDSHPELLTLFKAAARADEPLIKSTAAFCLSALIRDGQDGQAATKNRAEVLAELSRLLSDPYPDVRFNAATMLAVHGAAEAAPVLAEMLDPEQGLALQHEKQEYRISKRLTILVNGTRAARMLAERNPTVDLSEVQQALEVLISQELDLPESAVDAIDAEVRQTLRTLQNRSG